MSMWNDFWSGVGDFLSAQWKKAQPTVKRWAAELGKEGVQIVLAAVLNAEASGKSGEEKKAMALKEITTNLKTAAIKASANAINGQLELEVGKL